MMPHKEEHADSNCSKAIIDFINYTSVKIKKLSTFTQRIQAFRTLCLEDQTALMRRAGLDVLLLKSIMDSINPVTKQLELPPCNLQSLKLLGVDSRPHEAFIQAIDPTCFLDKNIALISCAVALFSSDRANFVHREVIEKKQESYKSLLRRYLHSVYAEFEAESMYTNMMQKLTEATRATESFRGVPLKVDTACFENLFGTLSNTDLEG
ncbi:unnamed protein product [Phaedon cochleariae]|uniref:NR LBD domain-containing protein n=1 Tax=Phaedon cochleariae TaxID=80249 RepID=A0A9N9X4S7_PHACE|nr:unnamed protein product [Phaedon cochleariae]